MEWNPKGSKYFTTVAIAFSVNSQLFSLFLEIKGNLINYILCYFGINLTEELHMHACMHVNVLRIQRPGAIYTHMYALSVIMHIFMIF